eukprot:TRINITY_DN15471_c0_g1_i1.p1 TRINITY_DN15471_c0_g1~~TRINITY_DN15471_c0_g1_i1.p1  ORF type:complete len:164 (-),score=28.99 TRINITY_DN15471_c0_g1_i1:98-589(-)
MSIYDDIIRSQVKQGYLGGKNGALGSYAKDKPKEKEVKAPKHNYQIQITKGEIFVSSDRNGLSDPYVVLKVDKLLGKTLAETESIPDNMQPEWNYTHTFVAREGTKVVVKMMDKDPIGSNTVGEYNITVCGDKKYQPMNFHPDGNIKLITARAFIEIKDLGHV